MTEPEMPFLGLDEIFSGVSVLGHDFSARLAKLSGKTIMMRGYLVPVTHDENNVYVLTSTPVASCSGCGSGHDWPDDAVFVLPSLGHGEVASGRTNEVQGRLDYGALRVGDTNTLVRLYDARCRPV